VRKPGVAAPVAAPKLQGDGLTLGRMCAIEGGQGPPATDAELEATARWNEKLPARTKQQLEEFGRNAAAAKQVYEAAPPWRQRQLWKMTVAEVAALGQRLGNITRPPVIHVPVRRENTARPRERRRSTSASRRGPPAGDDPSPSPAHDVDGLRGFRAASSRMFAHVGRRLGAGAGA
jgi:hypothetical protein